MPKSSGKTDSAAAPAIDCTDRRKHADRVNQLHIDPPAKQQLLRLGAVLLAIAWVVSVWTWNQGWWGVTVVAWLVAANIKHMQALGLHEAAHGLIVRNPRRNEIVGMLIGTMGFVPLSAYRFAHHFHHAHVGTTKDVELWPYNDPRIPRWQRVLTAQCELLLGGIYVPLQFLRAVIVAGGFSSMHARRIRAEYALLVGFWSVVFTVTAINGWWEPLLVAYFVPFVLAGFFQSLRKFTEHMGMFGDSPLTLTRSIETRGLLNRMISLALLHEDNHGAHHVFPKVPHSNLNRAIEHVYGSALYEPREPLYANYVQAVADMLPHLVNPRIGKQWLEPQRLPANRQL